MVLYGSEVVGVASNRLCRLRTCIWKAASASGKRSIEVDFIAKSASRATVGIRVADQTVCRAELHGILTAVQSIPNGGRITSDCKGAAKAANRIKKGRVHRRAGSTWKEATSTLIAHA
eukprot:617013-Amphidinium_carterae.1